MKDFTIQVNEKEDYGKRTNKSFLINLAFSLVIGLVAGYESEWSYGLGFGLLFFAIQFFKSNRWDKYYILSIIINENKIELTYNENNEKKFLKDDCVFFEFKKKSAISKSKIIYLAVFYKGNLIIEQSEEGEWNEAKFDKVLNAIS